MTALKNAAVKAVADKVATLAAGPFKLAFDIVRLAVAYATGAIQFLAKIGDALVVAKGRNPRDVGVKINQALEFAVPSVLNILASGLGIKGTTDQLKNIVLNGQAAMVGLVKRLVPWFKKKCKECEKKMMANQAAKKKQPVLQKGNTQAPATTPPASTPMKKPGGHCFSARMNADRHVGKSPLADRELLGRRVRSWREGEPGYAASHAHRYTRKDPNLHRVIWFMQEAGDGQSVEFGLLRSLLWMEENGAYQEGDRVAIDQPEMGVPGLARVLRIDPCAELEEGPGCLVTGWYRHSHGEIWEVVLEGGETIETTAQHPFWSTDRLAFVPACELQKNEHLSGREGLVRVLTVRKRPGVEPVYNIEVEGDHCYRVGKQGVLVHNASVYYRGDESGLKRILSHLAKTDGIPAARADFGKAKDDGEVDAWFALHAEESEDLDELTNSPFVSVTTSYAVACYFATSQGSGSVYTIEFENPNRVRKNRHNKKWVEIGGKRYPEREYLVPVYIRSKEIVKEDKK